MKEHAILFSAPMVRALLDGMKTQTRRAVAMPRDGERIAFVEGDNGWWPFRRADRSSPGGSGDAVPLTCPYGVPGDHLRVRETFFAYGRWATRYNEKKRSAEWYFVEMTVECAQAYLYAADAPELLLAKGRGATPAWYSRPAIFMPRVASRILLEVCSVRVERLQDIGEEDARAEGVQCNVPGQTFRDHYRRLWERINGAGSWDANPWIWVVEFRRIRP